MNDNDVCPDCIGTKVVECQGSIKQCRRCFGTGKIDSSKGYAMKDSLFDK